MKITIGTPSKPAIVERELDLPPSPPDPRPFKVRQQAVQETVVKNRRRKMHVIDGGKAADPKGDNS